jgi:hypothetical protein
MLATFVASKFLLAHKSNSVTPLVINMDSMKTIDARIVELEEQIKAEITTENRILNNVAEHFNKMTKDELPKVPDQETMQKIEEASKVLQLQPIEAKMIASRLRAALIVNPCALVVHSPTYRCSNTAVSTNYYISKTGSTTASCTTSPSPGKNELNPTASAYGFGASGWSRAVIYSWAWYEITPAYPAPQSVNIWPLVNIDGFYVLNGGGHVSLLLEARGYQYGYNWGSFSQIVLDKTGTTMGRIDVSKYLNFPMPVGIDPFQVLVKASLQVEARGSGANATGNFATGTGNTITSVYVNTYGTV